MISLAKTYEAVIANLTRQHTEATREARWGKRGAKEAVAMLERQIQRARNDLSNSFPDQL